MGLFCFLVAFVLFVVLLFCLFICLCLCSFIPVKSREIVDLYSEGIAVEIMGLKKSDIDMYSNPSGKARIDT